MKARRRLVLAVVAGAVAALGHAPFGLWPVALLGFAGLILLVSRPRFRKRPSAKDRPGWTAWAGGVGYFAVALHWIVEPFLVDVARHGWMAPFALVLLAAGLALFWGAAGWFSGRLAGNRALGFALALSLTELARGYVLTGFPWAMPAYIWTDTPVIMAASLIGPYGLTLATLALIATAVPDANAPNSLRQPVLAILGFGALFLVSNALQDETEFTGKTARLVQPNAPQDEKWDPDKAYSFVARQLEFTAAKAETQPDLIVWPESAVPYRLDNATPILHQIVEAADGVEVILGINRESNGLFHNALVTLPATTTPAEIYDKVHLVPFGEYIPFGQLAQLLGMQSFAARDGFGFSAGEGVRLIDTAMGRALPLICYEVIFPQHVRQAEARPDYLLQITNDAWFGPFSGPYQHLQQAQFRAAEQGLPLIRVANTGVSAMIGPDGQVIQSLPLGVAGYLDAEMPMGWAPTLYARTGDIPVGLLMIMILTALLFAKRRNTIATDLGSS